MRTKKLVAAAIWACILSLGLAALVVMLTDSELGLKGLLKSNELILFLSALAFLFCTVAFHLLFPGTPATGTRLALMLRLGAVAALFFLLPQSVVVYRETGRYCDNGFIRFAVCNFVDFVVVRLAFALIHDEQ